MPLNEVWIGSPHYSGSRAGFNKAVFHTTQGAMKIRDLGAWFQNPAAQCSSHHGADSFERGVFGAYVYEDYAAWTQGNANPYCLSIELCGYAEWSRDEWLNERKILVDNAAEWLRYIVGKYSIPWTVLNDSQAQNPNTRGICQHVNLGSWGSGHWDCGNGFPLDVVIEKAKSGSSTQGVDLGVSASAVIVNSKLHQAAVWEDGRVHYQFEGEGWYQVDTDANFKAQSGACITANQVTGLLVIMFTGMDGNVYSYQQKPATVDGPAAKGKWGRYSRGGWDSVR